MGLTGQWIPRPRKGRMENDCLHLLWCIAEGKCPPPQSYKSLSLATGIPVPTVWELINTDKEALKNFAYKYNYSLKIINCEDYILDVVYLGPLKNEAEEEKI